MKKIIFLVVIITTNLNWVLAQDSQKFNIGFALDPGISWLHPDKAGVNSLHSKISFGYGVNLDLNFQPNYALATGFFVNYRGGTLAYDSTVQFNSIDSVYAAGSQMSYNIEYITVPLVLKLSTNEIGYSKYYGKLGVDLNINVKPRGELTTFDGNTMSKIDIGKDVLPMDIGLYAALGTAYNVTQNVYLTAELFFHNGFIDQLKFADGYDSKVVLNNIGLQLGVQF